MISHRRYRLRIVFAEAQLVVLVAAIRYGRHLREAERFLAVYRALPVPPALVFLSVSLVARKPGKRTAQNNTYLRKSIARHKLVPAFASAIGGRLGLCAVRMGGQTNHPLHHEADRRADQSRCLCGIHAMGRSRRHCPADSRTHWPRPLRRPAIIGLLLTPAPIREKALELGSLRLTQ